MPEKTKDMLFQGFLPFAELSAELQAKINAMEDNDVFFFEGDPKEYGIKDIKNAVLLGRKGFLFLDSLNGLVTYPADYAIGQMFLTDLAKTLLREPNLDIGNFIKNLRSLAGLLEFGKSGNDRDAEQEAHEAFQRGEREGLVDFNDLNSDLTPKDKPKDGDK